MVITFYVELKDREDWINLETKLHENGYAFFTTDVDNDETLEEIETRIEMK